MPTLEHREIMRLVKQYGYQREHEQYKDARDTYAEIDRLAGGGLYLRPQPSITQVGQPYFTDPEGRRVALRWAKPDQNGCDFAIFERDE